MVHPNFLTNKILTFDTLILNTLTSFPLHNIEFYSSTVYTHIVKFTNPWHLSGPFHCHLRPLIPDLNSIPNYVQFSHTFFIVISKWQLFVSILVYLSEASDRINLIYILSLWWIKPHTYLWMGFRITVIRHLGPLDLLSIQFCIIQFLLTALLLLSLSIKT